MKEKFFKVAVYALLTLVVVGLIWTAIDPPKRVKTHSFKINETEMTIVEVESTICTSEETYSQCCYYLLNAKGDTLATRNWSSNPFINACGIVYVPQEGVYDFRGEDPILILEKTEMTNGSVIIEAIKGKDQVRITFGNPIWKLKALYGGDPGVYTYIYDLKEKKISKMN